MDCLTKGTYSTENSITPQGKSEFRFHCIFHYEKNQNACLESGCQFTHKRKNLLSDLKTPNDLKSTDVSLKEDRI